MSDEKKTKTIEIPIDAIVEIENFYCEKIDFSTSTPKEPELIGRRIVIKQGIQENIYSDGSFFNVCQRG